MTANVLLAPVGAGKTEHILQHLASTLGENPFARVWVLLATRRQEEAFRLRLAEWRGAGGSVFFNVEFFNFYELYQHILDSAANPQRQLSDAGRYALLRQIVRSIHDDLELFGAIADRVGFLRIVTEFIYELKGSRIFPEDFARAADTAKDRDLARIYSAYQDTLQRYGLVDREGMGWLAVLALQQNRTLFDDLTLVLVDGYDQFTPMQADILALLSGRADETLITLTAVEGREHTIGRRFQRALNDLQARFDTALQVERLGYAASSRQADLMHLIENIFLPDAPPSPSTGGVKLLELPDPEAETAAVLREVKRLLLNGEAPDDILIALRSWQQYRVHFSRYARTYGLPLALHYGEPLPDSAVIVALTKLLRLHEENFTRRGVLDVLHSPYFAVPGLSSDDIDLLERISLTFHVMHGEWEWYNALDLATRRRITAEDEDEADPLLTLEDAVRIKEALGRFFDAITPRMSSTIPEYVTWIENLIGGDPLRDPDDDLPTFGDVYSLNIVAQLRESFDEAIVAHDLQAMQTFKRVLRALLASNQLLRSMGKGDSHLSWHDFLTELAASIAATSVNAEPERSGRVLVTSAANARGLPHKHVFVPGMSEGLFPAQLPEDPLFLDTEREHMQRHGIPLETRSERAADGGLFYELICLPRETLTLSRPLYKEGKPWLPSPLWRATQAVFAHENAPLTPQRMTIGEVMPPSDAATRGEVATALVDAFVEGKPPSEAVLAWIQAEEAAYWRHILHAQAVEYGRMRGERFDHYSGVLRSDALREIVRDRMSGQHLWSASQFNDYAACGFRFFAKRLLKLESLMEPDVGMDAAQFGTLHHTILEETYKQIIQEDIMIAPENRDAALDILENVADAVFEVAPREIGFRPTELWPQQQIIIRRRLKHFVEVDFSAENPVNKAFKPTTRQPAYVESHYGKDSFVWLDLDEEVGAVRIHGAIDRIDRTDDGLIIIDYKTGSTQIPVSHMEGGRNFQMLVYLEAVQSLTSEAIQGGVFWHLRSQAVSGAVTMDEAAHQDAIASAKEHLARYITRARDGDFAVLPPNPQNGRCVGYCEYHQLCRYSVMSRGKR